MESGWNRDPLTLVPGRGKLQGTAIVRSLVIGSRDFAEGYNGKLTLRLTQSDHHLLLPGGSAALTRLVSEGGGGGAIFLKESCFSPVFFMPHAA